MKKLLSIFLIMLCFSGCKQNNDSELIKTEAVEAQQTAFVEKEGEVLVPESLRTVQLPIVGDSRVIVIDAGHQRRGDSNKEPIGPGASQTKAKVTTGATGISTGNLESAINLEVALKLQKKLEDSGYQVIMVRTSQDVNISNQQRAEIANKNNAGAFIRLHCNSDDSSSIHGTLTMVPSESNPYCSQIATASQRLSKTVVNSICNQTGSKNRGVIITDVMSGINWCQVPVTIVEMGFMSNPDEDRLLGDSTYQDKIVTGIVLGINEYFKN
ncbi:N-acetylmuramoyl-L-alanine amidase [Erysipelatoclostridium ramosum]|nr:N-acetylmuramoyl-L-alanine amidase [Thomasclavelia ramosa]MCB6436332.1 N-acetylmuramoyl-L-alanine amidase [Thomasclavelia ramosa]MCB6459385.1 N-acetylmuramoyl-L-alanine amidase [Thomasclavelia ramosa]MCB6597446.1 N-acetylmuramoyl-L-alanine amidase [Thomasclavelia ramosa]MCB6601234.1 N-acetylmuramoyl-L-alanine amidase [Thomasclavelia ramosa]MCB6619022.1 N-acetylmuramoyl-L-alanine amidase [Thomasclavelia ramosa]